MSINGLFVLINPLSSLPNLVTIKQKRSCLKSKNKAVVSEFNLAEHQQCPDSNIKGQFSKSKIALFGIIKDLRQILFCASFEKETYETASLKKIISLE